MQSELGCCGAYSMDDYLIYQSSYLRFDNLVVAGPSRDSYHYEEPVVYKFPKSCCRYMEADSTLCQKGGSLWTSGCEKEYSSRFDQFRTHTMFYLITSFVNQFIFLLTCACI